MKSKTYSYGKQSICQEDIQEVIDVLHSSWLTQGPTIAKFEKELTKKTGARYAVAVANGTAALHLSMLALGIKKGDEVITSPNTFLASANAVLYAGGTAKFADIEPETANIDPREIEKQITPQTKAIVVVHFAGHPCNMEKISHIAKKHNLLVIEDAAHAIGSRYKNSPVGLCNYSDLTTFSFHPVKTITTGEGGAITTNNPKLYEKLLMLRAHGVTKKKDLLQAQDIGSWYYEMQHLGFNYRLSDIHAALGISQLKKLDTFIQQRRKLVEIYRKAFANDERFSLLKEKEYAYSAYHLCPILIDFSKVNISKKELFEVLKKNNMHLQVHYIPVHLQPYYKQFGFKKGDYPNTEAYYEKTISLPLYPDLTENDIKKIVQTIKKAVQ